MNFLNFKEWFLIEASGMSGNFLHQSLQQRMKQGKIGEAFVVKQLRAHGLRVSLPTASMDKNKKIDGMLNNSEPIQIKVKPDGGSEDLSFEVCLIYDENKKLTDQIKDLHRVGRDYKGNVDHYFLMNNAETFIFHFDKQTVRKAIDDAIQELNKTRGGYLTRRLAASSGVALVPTIDRHSGVPKVMAFIPSSLAHTKYEVLENLEDEKPKTELDLAIIKAKETGVAEIAISSTNPKNIMKKKEEINKRAKKEGLKFKDEGTKVVISKI